MRLGTRQIHAQKSGSLVIGEGFPDREVGADGDLRLHLTSFGLKLYAKYKGQWFAFTPDGGRTTQELITTTSTGSAAEKGYVEFPGGFLIQWGKDTAPANAYSSIKNFPIAFPHRVVSLVGSKSTKHSGAEDGNDAGIEFVSNSTYRVYSDDNERDVY